MNHQIQQLSAPTTSSYTKRQVSNLTLPRRTVQHKTRFSTPNILWDSPLVEPHFYDHDSTVAKRLDFATISNACQAISDAIDLGWLLEEAIHLILQHSAADRAVIILKEQGQLLIEAEGKATSHTTNILQSLPIDHPKACKLSIALVHIVAHTQEAIMLNYGRSNTPFIHDSYLRQKKPTSVLCIPLIHCGQLHGIFYLEKQQPPAAFSAQKLEMLKFFSRQVAISIENALQR